MNKERMEKVAEVIEDYEDHFDMGYWMVSDWQHEQRGKQYSVKELVSHFDVNECGSAGCVAGWACWLWSSELRDDDTFREAGRRILDLTDAQAERLFEMSGDAQFMAEELRNWTIFGAPVDDDEDEEDCDD